MRKKKEQTIRNINWIFISQWNIWINSINISKIIHNSHFICCLFFTLFFSSREFKKKYFFSSLFKWVFLLFFLLLFFFYIKKKFIMNQKKRVKESWLKRNNLIKIEYLLTKFGMELWWCVEGNSIWMNFDAG